LICCCQRRSSSGHIQCTRLNTSGEPKRRLRGDGASSGIVETDGGCRSGHNHSISAWLMLLLTRAGSDQLSVEW
jgi:hypothetical protein